MIVINPTEKVRNIGVVAHVDHGKTTLVGSLLKLMSADIDQMAMDSNSMEASRGITILAKITSIIWQDYLINILDTPGHADFGGEVERSLFVVDGVILLVDAKEGIKQQTEFVIRKTIQHKLPIICVINKVDRPDARIEEVELEVMCYLSEIDPDLQVKFLYASGREGWVSREMYKKTDNMNALLEEIVEKFPAPIPRFEDNETRFSVRMLDHDQHLGKIVAGRIESGSIYEGQNLFIAGTNASAKVVKKIMKKRQIQYYNINKAQVGDLVSLAGFSDATVGDTLVANINISPMEIPQIDPPTIFIRISANSSPLSGNEGKQITFQVIQDRLQKAANLDPALSLSIDRDAAIVGGRGIMHLGVLLENMRKEGFEMTVYPPEVNRKGNTEPWEKLHLEFHANYLPIVMKKLINRNAEILSTDTDKDLAILEARVATRNILGYESEFGTDTKGSGTWEQAFDGYGPISDSTNSYENGTLISMATGEANSYALNDLESRGKLYIKPGMKVYPGMIIGECNKEQDIEANPTKAKKVTNIRASGKDEAIKLIPVKDFTVEDALLLIAGKADQCVELTPISIRLRMKILDSSARKKQAKS